MQVSRAFPIKVLMFTGMGFLILAGAPKSRAQSDDVAGQYVCSEARVAGKAVTCTAPPLSLKSDGKFELQGREGEYLVIEDLSRRPVVARLRNISDINRMFWIDDKADAVEPLFRVLGYEKIPSYFIAFFPVELERELLKKELEYRNLPENKIEETKFQIRHGGSKGYEAVVTSQEAKP